MHPYSALYAVALGGLAACAIAPSAQAAPPTHLTRSIIVQAPPSTVWRLVGPFCTIGTWHPAIGSCRLDDTKQPTRTLVTKDGAATFVELEVARNDAAHRYSYSFTSAPVPVSNYVSTFSVRAKGRYSSVVTWSSDYIPNAGQETAAETMLTGIYDSGLAAIRDRFTAPQLAH